MPHEVKSIHYLRGLAALLVVFHHSIIQLAPVRDHYAHVEFGQAGVDIFFVISGFVIYLSNAKGRLGSGEFLKRRIIRIVPLYWLATLAVVAVAVVAPRFFATTTLTAQDVAQSLLFVPAYSAAFPGQIWPVLVPGWSLNYEMFFYLVFAVGLLVARERLLLFLVATLGILVVAGLLLDPQPRALEVIHGPEAFGVSLRRAACPPLLGHGFQGSLRPGHSAPGRRTASRDLASPADAGAREDSAVGSSRCAHCYRRPRYGEAARFDNLAAAPTDGRCVLRSLPQSSVHARRVAGDLDEGGRSGR